jgi:hypothetical protein
MGRLSWLAALVLAGSTATSPAAGRWQLLTEGVEFDADSFKESRDEHGRTAVQGWVRYLLADPRYWTMRMHVRGDCEARLMAYDSRVRVRLDGTEESDAVGGTLAVTPDSLNELILKAMCKHATPWWKSL